MGVRADQEGRLLRDSHTAGKGGYLRASGDVERDTVVLSSRYYLADARFLVALEGDGAFLQCLHGALRDPVWLLYLGRKAFPPGEPVWLADGYRAHEGLLEALQRYPWLGVDPERRPAQVRLVIDDPDGAEVRPDGVPPSFAQRVYLPRRVSTRYIPAPDGTEEAA